MIVLVKKAKECQLYKAQGSKAFWSASTNPCMEIFTLFHSYQQGQILRGFNNDKKVYRRKL